jgi:hypothetical protein
MKKAAVLSLIFCFLVVATGCGRQGSLEAGRANTEALVRLLPAAANAVSALDVHRLVSAVPAQKFLNENREKYMKLVADLGFDPLSDVYLVVSGAAVSYKPMRQESVVIFNLKYDRAKIDALIKRYMGGAFEEKYREVPVITGLLSASFGELEFKLCLAFLDASNIAFGTEPFVKGVIDVYKKQAEGLSSNPDMARLLKTTDRNAMAWGGLLFPEGLVKEAVAGNQNLKVVEGVRGISGSLNYAARNLSLRLTASGGTEQQNKDLAAVLNGFKVLGAGGIEGDESLSELLNSIAIEAGRDYTRIYADIPEELLEKAAAQNAPKLKEMLQRGIGP